MARKTVEAVLVAKYQGKLLAAHLTSRRKDRERRAQKDLSEKLLERYKKERAEERSARVTGLTHPSAAGGWKMAAFKDSAYGFATMNAKNKQLAFMQGIQNKDIQIQGNTALVMWFQGLTKYLKPRKKKAEAA